MGEVTVLLNTAGTIVKLTSSPNPSTLGQAVTFTATVTISVPTFGASVPTGTITFKDGTTTLGTGTLSQGKANFTTSTLAVGKHSIQAVYSGDTTYNPKKSPVLTQTVN